MKSVALALLVALCASAANWTDRKEYDLVLNIRSESSPQKRLGLLDQWKTAYPKSEFQPVRRELYLNTYQALGDNPHTLSVAGEILAADPSSTVGAYWFTLLLPEQRAAAPEQLVLGEKAGKLLLAATKSPAGVELMAHRTLGWIHWQKNEYAPAEAEFQKCLQLDPTATEISAWLGTVMALEQQPEKRVPALWQLARASAYRSAGSLPDGMQRQFGTVLERLYTSYHGDTSGLEELRAAAAAAVFPPAGFNIESVATIAIRKHEEQLSQLDPSLAAWVRIRQKLEGPDGDKYFAETLHPNPLPKLKGTLLKAEPAGKPTELTVGIIDPTKPELLIKLSAELPNDAAPGTILEFEGTAESMTKTPFVMTVTSDPMKISGWPAKDK